MAKIASKHVAKAPAQKKQKIAKKAAPKRAAKKAAPKRAHAKKAAQKK